MIETIHRDLEIARALIEIEAESLRAGASRLGPEFIEAVDIIARPTGKVVLCGVGKSGIAARKIAATFCSVGIPAVSLHPMDAMHGDLGLVRDGDAIIFLSKSGETEELVNVLLRVRANCRCTVIGLLGNVNSTIARECDIRIDTRVDAEGCPLNLAPMSSAMMMMAIGDALAGCIIERRGLTADDFGRFHPGGNIGRRLLACVRDVMHHGDELPLVSPNDTLRQCLVPLSSKRMGAVLVVDDEEHLLGIFTDGDLRRVLESTEDLLNQKISTIMTTRATVCSPSTPAWQAIKLMEDRPSQISLLPVVTEYGRVAGIVRIHDLVRHSLSQSKPGL